MSLKDILKEIANTICFNQMDKVLYIVDTISEINFWVAFFVGMVLLVWMMYCLLSVLSGSNFWISVLYLLFLNTDINH